MQNLDAIKGYVNIDDYAYPFSFETSDFILRLYPPTPEKWQDDMFSVFRNGLETKKHKWVGAFEISGITSNDYKIILIYCIAHPFSMGLRNMRFSGLRNMRFSGSPIIMKTLISIT